MKSERDGGLLAGRGKERERGTEGTAEKEAATVGEHSKSRWPVPTDDQAWLAAAARVV